MKTICYASWKGGTGKTLLAFNTLERAAAGGISALGCDFDPQRMLSRQCAIRERHGEAKNELEIVEGELSVNGIDRLIQVQQENSYDLIVCDLPGADAFVMDRVFHKMDTILIPINAAPYELLNTTMLVRKIQDKSWNTYLVPNNIPPTQKRKEETHTTVRQMGTPVAPVCVVRRLVHWDAAMVGLTANEFAPGTPAAVEIREYWAWLQGAAGISQKYAEPAKEVTYA